MPLKKLYVLYFSQSKVSQQFSHEYLNNSSVSHIAALALEVSHLLYKFIIHIHIYIEREIYSNL